MSLISTMLESSAVIKRPTIGRDAAQGTTQDPFKIIASNLPCSCQQAGASVQALYAQRNTFVSTTVYFAQDPNTEVNDLMIITDRTGKAQNYLVQGEAQSVGRGRLYSVDTTLVRAPV